LVRATHKLASAKPGKLMAIHRSLGGPGAWSAGARSQGQTGASVPATRRRCDRAARGLTRPQGCCAWR